MMTVRCLALFIAIIACAPVFAQATAKKPTKPKPPAANATKGQAQLAGVNGQFGTVYTLQTGFNLALLGASYTLEPLLAYSVLYVGREEKLLVINVAIKNAMPEDQPFNSGPHSLTAVDADNQNYSGSDYVLQSQPSKSFYPTVRPGQGIGQGTDLLQVGIKVPAKARIVKIMLNQGRKGRNEEVVRYFVAGATKAEAGEVGDPKNVITPLPVALRATGDTTGAVLATPLTATVGTDVTSGAFALRVEGITYSTTETYNAAPPEEGKQFAFVTVTAKYIGAGESLLYNAFSNSDQLKLNDADGEEAAFVGTRKAKSDEEASKTFNSGDTYTFRAVFSLSAKAKAGKLRIGAGDGPLYQIDLSDGK